LRNNSSAIVRELNTKPKC